MKHDDHILMNMAGEGRLNCQAAGCSGIVIAVPPREGSLDLPPAPGPSPSPATSAAAGHPTALEYRPRRKLYFPDRLCDCCHHWYKPRGGSQLYCLDCRPGINAERQRLWRQENHERAKAYWARYRDSHASVIRAYQEAHIEHSRERARNYARARYARDPAACKAYQTAWRLANLEKWRATQLRYRNTPCRGCGRVRQLAGPQDKRTRLFCRDCKSDTNWVLFNCYWCNGLIGVKPRERKRSKHYHRGCLGALTDAGIVLHITRERVRQLVNRQLARLGDGYSRADALEMVMKERLP